MDAEKREDVPETDTRGDLKNEYPPAKRVIPAMVALYLSVFLIALVILRFQMHDLDYMTVADDNTRTARF